MGKKKQDAPKQNSWQARNCVGGKGLWLSMTSLCLVSSRKPTVDIIYILALQNNIHIIYIIIYIYTMNL